MDTAADNVDELESFRQRARSFVRNNLSAADPDHPSDLSLAEAKLLQATIFDAGLAGIAVPRAYGGAGLSLAHQEVWAEEVEGYVVPTPLFVSMGMLGITLLEHGSETLKKRHLPRILRGEEVWLQLLSEPSGGSDMAGVITRASRDGETWIVNGAKMWSTGAAEADYGMCLARTDWDAPKHRGLSMFAMPLKDPQVTIEPIVGIDGGPAHFFQEFFDEVSLPLDHLIGVENEGWSVAHTLLFHERNATAGVGHGLGLGGGREGSGGGGADSHGVEDLVRYAGLSRSLTDPAIRQLIAEAYVADRARHHANDRVTVGMRTGAFKGDWGSLLKLGLALDTLRRAEIAISVAGADGVIWGDESPGAGSVAGRAWLNARSISIAGGTNEMQRNIVSERLLGLPREPAADRDAPFSEVIRRRDR
ncbi:MAG TPA: acyl-CoA dehydrogenase family protein [Acidimicrobiales bacterium]|nr:acyl-CoA dehydrogenase family protein [Acidimicrobiales bacterium]